MNIKTFAIPLVSLIGAGAVAACSSDSDPDRAPPVVVNEADGGPVAPKDLRNGPECSKPRPTRAPGNTATLPDEITPPPASIGSDVPVTYFGPAPSSVNPRLVGPFTYLKAGKLDLEKGVITLPLYKGLVASTGKTIYYILTDTSDKGIADGLGLNYSAKLKFANAGAGTAGTLPARQAHTTADATLRFDNGTVDFNPTHAVTPGAAPNYFPPAAVQPGSVGDQDYTPVIYVQDQGIVFNAPVVAYGNTDAELDFCNGAVDHTKVHDKVTAICPKDQTVTLSLTQGFSFGKPVLYLSTDASDPLPAALEQANYAPALKNTKVGGDDSAFSPVERLFAFTNGPGNVGTVVNPQRQGLNSAVKGEGGPLNVLGGIPHVATDYSPLWDFNLGEWTATAITKGYRSRVNEEFQILGLVQRGFITGPAGAKWGSTGIIVNCPIVHRFL